MRITLISPAEVVQYSPVDARFPAAEFASHIQRVERKMARQTLGATLYNEMLADRQSDGRFTKVKYQRLWNEHLRAYIAYQVALAHVTYSAMKYTAQGVQITETEYSKAADYKELSKYESALKSDIEDMRIELEHYLRVGDFPTAATNADTHTPIKPKRGASPFIMRSRKKPSRQTAVAPSPNYPPEGTISDGEDDYLTDGEGDFITDGSGDNPVADPTPSPLPVRWLSGIQTGAAWTFSFAGQLRPVNVDLLAAYDTQDNDITNLVTSYQINVSSGVIDVILATSATGRVELVSN